MVYKQISKRMDRLQKAGLIGCFDDTGVNSSNYKEFIYGSQDFLSFKRSTNI